MTTITLAGQVFEIASPPFGKLRKIIGSFNRMRNSGMESDEAMSEVPLVLGLLTDKTPDEVDAMTITMQEMVAALAVVPEICGLVQKETASGEAPAVTDGTISTPI